MIKNFTLPHFKTGLLNVGVTLMNEARNTVVVARTQMAPDGENTPNFYTVAVDVPDNFDGYIRYDDGEGKIQDEKYIPSVSSSLQFYGVAKQDTMNAAFSSLLNLINDGQTSGFNDADRLNLQKLALDTKKIIVTPEDITYYDQNNNLIATRYRNVQDGVVTVGEIL